MLTGAPVRAVIERWRAKGVPLQQGLPAATIITAFEAEGRELSADVLALYMQCNGMPEYESDGQLFSFWPLAQAVREARRFDPEYMPFADFLMSSHDYCFRYETVERSSVFYTGASRDGRPTKLADSVDEFFHLLMRDPDKAQVSTSW